jgi:hypothetical protein
LAALCHHRVLLLKRPTWGASRITDDTREGDPEEDAVRVSRC